MYWVSVHSLALLVFIFWIFNIVWKKLILSERAIKEDLPLYKLSPVSTTTRKCKLSSSTMTDQPKAKTPIISKYKINTKPPKSDSQPYIRHTRTSSQGEVQWAFSTKCLYFWIYKQEPRLYFPRGEVSWWIWDYINYYSLQSIPE